MSLRSATTDYTDGCNFRAPEGKGNTQIPAERISEEKHWLTLDLKKSFGAGQQRVRYFQKLWEICGNLLPGSQAFPSDAFQIVRKNNSKTGTRQCLFSQIVEYRLFPRSYREGPC